MNKLKYHLQELLFLPRYAEPDMIVPWTSMLGWKILDEDCRKHIEGHKYKAGVYTPLDNVLNPWWLYLTNQLPQWLAPNLVTFAGFLPLLMSYLACWYYCPGFDTAPPRWLCFMMSGSLFIYQTMDAMDGKQARRINHSTPLGQLFDHGADCVACISHHSMAACICLPGATKWNLAGLAVLQTSFFLAQWQEKHTGVLFTCFGPVGVTETQYGLMAFTALGGILGPTALKSLMATPVVGALTVCHVFISGWILMNFCLMTLSFCTTMMRTVEKKKEGEWVAPSILGKEHKEVSVRRALRELLPIIFLDAVFMCGWHEDVITLSPRLLCLSFAFLFVYLTAQMIVFSMACFPFNPIQYMLLPFAAIAVASKFAWLPLEMLLVRVTLGIHTVVVFFLVLFWLLTVIQEITAHLGIRVFTVVHKAE